MTTEPVALLLIRIGVMAAVTIAAVAILNSDRGVPLALLILLGFVVGFQLLTTRTTFGRHLFAVGGSAEAARRAGIGINKIRVTPSCSAPRWRRSAASSPPRGWKTSTRARAAPTCCWKRSPARSIAGTSLFGGRGSVWSALLGATVIGSIANGINLLALESSVKLMITGGVLLAAVVVDAVARSRRRAEGRV